MSNEVNRRDAETQREEYDPLDCLDKEIQRFKSTNQFSPMLVTGFYLQAACVVTELKESRELINALAVWDTTYPKGTVHHVRAEALLDDLMRKAHFIRKRYPKALRLCASAVKTETPEAQP